MKKTKHVIESESKLIADVARVLAEYEIGVVLERASPISKKRYRDMARKALRTVEMI